MFEKILEAIKEYNTIVIHRHSSPDGDALGSQIGLKNIIKDNFPEKAVYAVGDGAKRYSFMDGSVMDEIEDSVYDGALAVILDCGAAHLISDERWKLAAKTVRIDHHIFCEKIADDDKNDTEKPKRIGFCVPEQNENANGNDVAAVAKK
jgi:phosphoesterase RecJ-like protein